MCTYDTCFADADCKQTADAAGDPAPAVCGCSAGINADNNACLQPGNCLTDADCHGGYCSPSFGVCGDYDGVTTYYCHTDQDECVDDADCRSKSETAYCAYSVLTAKWACSESQCAG